MEPGLPVEESSQLSFLKEDELTVPGRRRRGRKPGKRIANSTGN